MTDTYRVSADELRQFIETHERLDAEKSDLTEMQKENMAEAKSRGYDVAAMKELIKLRKKSPDEVAEQAAILDIYQTALQGGN